MGCFTIRIRNHSNSICALFISGIAALLFTCLAEASPPPPDENVFNYQGRVVVNGANFDGSGDCRFAILDENDQFLWSNSALSGNVPTAPVGCVATNGLVSVLLGDSSLMNMDAIPDSVFLDHDFLFLRFWFDDKLGNGIQELSPDQLIAPVPGAIVARHADQVADGAVTTDKIADGAVTGDKIAMETITGNNIVDGTVDQGDLDTGDVDDRYVNQDGDTMDGALGMGGNNITGVGSDITAVGPLSVSATGGNNDLELNSDGNITLNALSGSVNINASNTTIFLNANTVVDGTLTTPSIRSEDVLSLVGGDESDVTIDSDGVISLNARTQINGTLLVTEFDSNINAVTDVLTVSHNVGGSNADDGIGTGILLQAENDSGNATDIGEIVATMDNVATGSETSTLSFYTRKSGGLNEVMFIDENGDVTANSFTAGSTSTSCGDGAIAQMDAGGNFIIDVAGGDAAGEDFIVVADDFSIDAGGNVMTGGTFSAGGTFFNGNVDLGTNSILNVGKVDFGENGDDDLVASDVSTLTGNTDASSLHHHDGLYVNADGDLMSGDLNMGTNNLINTGENITGNAGLTVSAVGVNNDLNLSSERDVNLNALNGDINLNASDTTIKLNANTDISGDLSVTGAFSAGGATLSADLDMGNSDITNVGAVDGVDISAHDHSGGASGAQFDHGNLSGLGDDDHTQYLELDGTDLMGGDLNMGGNKISNVGTVDGVDVFAHAGGGSGVHGVVAGSVVGNSDTQTLTNKTLTTPAIDDFTSATHDHTDASDGGGLSDYLRIVPGSAQTISTAPTTMVHLNETSASAPNLMELEVAGTDKFVVDNQGNVMATSFIAGSATTVFADGSLTSGGDFSIDAGSGSNLFSINAVNISIDSNGDIGPVGLVDGIDVNQHFHGARSTESFVVIGSLSLNTVLFAGPGIQTGNTTEEHFMICHAAGSVEKMSVYVEMATLVGSGLTVTVRKNEVDTSMAVWVTAASVAAGDRIGIKLFLDHTVPRE